MRDDDDHVLYSDFKGKCSKFSYNQKQNWPQAQSERGRCQPCAKNTREVAPFGIGERAPGPLTPVLPSHAQHSTAIAHLINE